MRDQTVNIICLFFVIVLLAEFELVSSTDHQAYQLNSFGRVGSKVSVSHPEFDPDLMKFCF